jgi:hypothetical protein
MANVIHLESVFGKTQHTIRVDGWTVAPMVSRRASRGSRDRTYPTFSQRRFWKFDHAHVTVTIRVSWQKVTLFPVPVVKIRTACETRLTVTDSICGRRWLLQTANESLSLLHTCSHHTSVSYPVYPSAAAFSLDQYRV